METRNGLERVFYGIDKTFAKRQMGYVCHTNKCCQSNSPKQYKNTDLFTQKEYSWPHWSHSNSSLLFFLLLWNQCYQDCYFWVKNQCYYITFLSMYVCIIRFSQVNNYTFNKWRKECIM